MNTIDQLRPYMNPEYWDGHMVGDGDALPLPRLDSQGLIRGARYLRERLSAQSTIFPLETFSDGDTFSPDSYEPGTITLAREESLLSKVGQDGLPVLPNGGSDLPVRRYDTAPYGALEEISEHIRIDGIGYHSMVWWGLVVAHKGRHTMPRTSVTNVYKKESGGVSLLTSVLIPGDFRGKIGETKHQVFRNGSEQLSRVNRLHVIAYGQTKKAQNFIGVLGKLARGSH